jgi:hypothetical protein
MSVANLKKRLTRLAPRPGQRRKLTTSENRQALDQILAKLDCLPADAPPHPDTTGLAEAQREVDRVLAVMERPAP